MKKKIFLLVVTSIAVGSLFYFSPFLRKKIESVPFVLESEIEDATGMHFSFQEAHGLFDPFPVLVLTAPRLESSSPERFTLSARQVRCSFEFFPLLLGRIHISKFEMQEGEGIFYRLPFEHFNAKMEGSRPAQYASFQAGGKWMNGAGAFSGKGKVQFQKGSERFWEDLEFKMEMAFHPISLDKILAEGEKKFPFFFSLGGQGEGVLKLTKERKKNALSGNLQFQVLNFRSGSNETFSPSGEANFLWDLTKDSFVWRDLSLKTPFGEVNGEGIFKTETWEVEEARLTGRQMVLQELIRHFPSLNFILPFDIGFSGESDFDLTLRGAWDYLSLHANWNLTPALLTYGSVFSKPKNFPFRINMDFLLKEGAILSGDFSIRLSHTTIKGALLSLGLKTGEGELTILTNKFDLREWSPLLIFFGDYKISGSAKALLNFKGNLTRLDRALQMANLTLEQINLLSPANRGVRDLNLLLDISPLNFRIKETHWEAGGSRLEMDAEIYGLHETPRGSFSLRSPRLDVFKTLEDLRGLRVFLPREAPFKKHWIKAERLTRRYLPHDFELEGLDLEVGLQQNQWILKTLEFGAFEGKARWEGKIDTTAPRPQFQMSGKLSGMQLARYFEGWGRTEILEGSLFLTGNFQAEGRTQTEILQTLSGSGNLSVTNGEWPFLDLSGSIQELGPFQNLTFPGSRSTPFSDLEAGWTYEKGKFNFSDFLLHSQDFWMEGEGTLSLEGVLNSRMDIYLSESLTRQAFKNWSLEKDPEGKQLGPIPFLLIGTLEKLNPQPDERRLEPFLEAIRSQRLRKILHNPFQESLR